jgi:hypothetical protein
MKEDCYMWEDDCYSVLVDMKEMDDSVFEELVAKFEKDVAAGDNIALCFQLPLPPMRAAMLDKLGPTRALIHFIDKEEAKTARFDHVLMRGIVDIWPSYAASPKFRFALPDVNILTSGQIRNVSDNWSRPRLDAFRQLDQLSFDDRMTNFQRMFKDIGEIVMIEPGAYIPNFEYVSIGCD